MHTLRSLVGSLRRARALVCLVATVAAVGLTMLSARTVWADPSDRLGYSQQQVYSAAVRFLRIDLRYEIVERDPDAAYLLFEYQPLGQKNVRFGAVEIVKLQRGVRLVVRLPDQPSYQETMLRDGLIKKLRTDYGETAPESRDKGQDVPKSEDDENSGSKEPENGNKPPRPNARS